MQPRYLIGICLLLLAAGCGQEMDDQPKQEAYEATRRPPAGSIAQDMAAQPPPKPALTAELLHRGRERFEIFCSPCHGRTGYGDGMIVERGFPRPPSYHTRRLRRAPDRHFYEVMTAGYGVMFPYAARVPPTDRWAIVAYVRALQLSQHARPEAVPSDVSVKPEQGAGGSRDRR